MSLFFSNLKDYISKNPVSPRGYEKLSMASHSLFKNRKILIVKKIIYYYGWEGYSSYFPDWAREHQRRGFHLGCKDEPPYKLWIIGHFSMVLNGSDGGGYIEELRGKIFKMSAEKVTLKHSMLTSAEYEFFTANRNMKVLEMNDVQISLNDEILPLEKMLELVKYIQTFV